MTGALGKLASTCSPLALASPPGSQASARGDLQRDQVTPPGQTAQTHDHRVPETPDSIPPWDFTGYNDVWWMVWIHFIKNRTLNLNIKKDTKVQLKPESAL